MAPRRFPLIVLLAPLLCAAVGAQARSLEVAIAGKALLDTDPGQVVTSTFRATNRTRDARDVAGTLELPAGWSAVTREMPFVLDPGASDLRLISFLVPATAAAGRYRIGYAVQDRGASGFADRVEVDVIVRPVWRLSVEHVNAPAMVFAGESYETRFVVANAGNAATPIELAVDSAGELPFELLAAGARLEPGESMPVTIRVDTDASAERPYKHRLTLTASSAGEGSAQAQQTSHVEVLPVTRHRPDLYHRIPTWLTLRVVGDDDGAAVQAEWVGAGSLDEAGAHQVDFLFRAPSLRDRSSFGQLDEYSVGYRSGGFAGRVGDQQFALSALTEPGRFGRGLAADIALGSWHVGGYHLDAPVDESDERQSAVRGLLSAAGGRTLGLQVLDKSGDGGSDRVFAVDGVQPFPGGRVQLELAYSAGDAGTGLAHLADAYGRLWGVDYTARYLHAGRDFAGAHHDRTFAVLGLQRALNERVTLNASARVDDRGPPRGRPDDVAPYENQLILGASWRVAPHTTLGLDVEHEVRRDRSPRRTFDTVEDTVNLSAQRSFKRLVVDSSVEIGRVDDRRTGRSDTLMSFTAAGTYRHAPGQVVDGFVRYERGGEVFGTTLTASVGGSMRVGGATFLDLDYRVDRRARNVVTIQHGFSGGVRHELPNRHVVSVRGRHRSSGSVKETSALLEYRMPFGLPVRPRSDVGTVRGRVLDNQDGEPVAGLVVKLGREIAVSDQEGRFSFPALAVGTYSLTVDYRRTGLDKVVLSKLPLEIRVTPGQSMSIDLAVDRSSAVVGAVVLEDAQPSAGDGTPSAVATVQPGVAVGQGLNSVVVELRGDDEVHRRLTGRGGRFEFTGLRPGVYELGVLPDGLPAGAVVAGGARRLVLRPAAEEEVTITAKPRLRVIRMIDEGKVIEEQSR